MVLLLVVTFIGCIGLLFAASTLFMDIDRNEENPHIRL